MSTFISEPGTRLAGRYRLEDRVSDTAGGALWKAIDETLARPVAVLTFAPGFPRVYQVVTAARAASRMTDSRLAQVFDVEDSGDRAYVVLEWVNGHSLDDLVAAGPLEPARAAGLVAEAAQAMSTAHAAGLAHLCLTPRSLLWTPGGGIKITGLAVEAALYGAHADDPAVADTQGLGRLLYAALTAHWPGEGGSYPAVTVAGTMWGSPLASPTHGDPILLPPAPAIDGELCSPRQVCAGVPAAIDTVTSLALWGRPSRGRPAITSPAALAEALATVVPSASLTPPSLPLPRDPSGPLTPPHPAIAADKARTGERRPTDRPRVSKAVGGIVVLFVIAALGLAAWTVSHSLGGKGHSGGHTRTHASTAAVATLTPVSAQGFDVYDTNGQDGNENSSEAPRVIDGDPRTAWHTLFYKNDPVFGRLKNGTGLILDMGRPVKLSTVAVLFGPTSGADVQVEVGNTNAVAPASLSAFTVVASANDIPGGSYTFHASRSATGRYVLIWFTRLPPEPRGPKNHYEAEIFNIALRGSG